MDFNFWKNIKNPLQYLNHEPNTAAHQKNWNNVKLKFLLAYPDLYEIGASNLGIQILYKILNSTNDFLCDRIYAPDIDLKKCIEDEKVDFLTVELKRKPVNFDVIGFSMQYELNYTTALAMLKLMKIPVLSKDRLNNNNIPLICAGGPAVFNPVPLADFFDFFAIGDGEELIIEKCKTIVKNKEKDKKEILKELSKIEGIYVPLIHNSSETKIKKRVISKFKKEFLPYKPIVPITKSVHKRLAVEVSRGCTAGCRFCQAGIIYRPVREKSIDLILNEIEKGISNTGYDEISLLSLSIGDFTGILSLINCLKFTDLKISLPSIRANRLNENLINFLLTREKSSFTIAPEAGTDRLRKIINKNLTDNEIINACDILFKKGWNLIKLYFMIGLPEETEEDLKGIVDLCFRIIKIAKKYSKRNKIHVSISPFVPKPHTPFQWYGQSPVERIIEKIDYLKEKIKHKKIELKWHNPYMSLVEAVLSRGDKTAGKLLYKAFKNGAYLEAWSNHFDINKWEDIDNLKQIAEKNYKIEDILPWDFIDTGVKKEFLINEFILSKKLLQTSDCRFSNCKGCGLCDFKNIKNVNAAISNKKLKIKRIFKDIEFKKVRVFFEKKGLAVFCGAIATSEIIIRAINRSGIKVKYTQGFKPRIKISFSPPPPFGEERENLYFDIFIEKNINPEEIFKLNKYLFNGFKITKVKELYNFNFKT